MASVEGVPACLLATVPVVQPPHLEGDPSLATEILPGPPSLQSIQQGVARKDHKKSGPAFSYLPVSDPGTTYGGHMVSPLAPAPNEVDGPRRKRARLDKNSASSRAQRASARNLAVGAPSEAPLPLESVASSSQVIPDSDPLTAIPDSEDVVMSRANSVPLLEASTSTVSAKRSGKDKGKEKDRDVGARVKEEVMPVVLHSYETSPALPNEDHCSACRSLGSLVYCDGCPRAYHLWCLNPPMEATDLPEGDSRWFCPACTRRQNPPLKPLSSLKFMAPLISQVQNVLPAEYQLPQEVRTFFKDVGTGPKGTYVDTSEIKPPRLNRHGQLEDREPYRLKDRNGEPVLCFNCGKSALPPDVAAAAPAAKRARRSTSVLPSTSDSSGRMMISCDYCHLNWHLDCVDPPLAYMPPWGKKWMCPNHADQILKPKKRIPRQVAPIDVTKPGQWNNGNIEIIHPESSYIIPTKVAVDEVLINGRRYRVPERVITMDFWNRAQGKDKGKAKEVPMEEVDYTNSASSSPLTELSSLPDIDEPEASPAPLGLFDLEEVQAALFLCSLHSHHSTASDSKADENEVLRQLEPRIATNGVSKRPPRASSTRAAERIASSRAYAYEPTSSIQRESKPKTKRSAATHRHDDSSAHPPSSFPVPALRELRPRMDHKDAFPASLSAPPHNGIDTSESASVGPQSSISPIDEPSGSKTSARPQRSRNFPRRTPAPLTGVRTSSRTNGTLSELDDDDDDYLSLMEEPFIPSSSRAKISDPTDKPRKRGRPPLHKKPITPAPAVVASNPITPSVPKAEASTATPSLKIRLPRLNTINQQASHSNTIHDDAPVPASLAPPTPPQPPKRGRGRPRKYPLDNHNRGPGRPPKSGPRRVERRASSSRTSATEIPLPDTQMALS